MERDVHLGLLGGGTCVSAAGGDCLRVKVSRPGPTSRVAAGPWAAPSGCLRRNRRAKPDPPRRPGRLRLPWVGSVGCLGDDGKIPVLRGGEGTRGCLVGALL